MAVLKLGPKTFKDIIVLSGIAGLLSACALQPTTYGTGESVELGLIKDVTSLATFGAIGKEKRARIDYRERGALIVPPDIDQAAIPHPLQKVDDVGENFPGRGEEILREQREAKRKEIEGSPNSIIGNPRAQPILNTKRDTRFDETKKARKLLKDAERSNKPFSVVGNSASDAREALKTREDLAKERGVSVESIPQVVSEKSILERAGLVRKKTGRAGESLTDVPVEYRTVHVDKSGDGQQADVENLLKGKKKKKKRFIFF